MALKLKLGDALHEVEILARRPSLVLRIDGRLCEVETPPAAGSGDGAMVVNGEKVSFVRVGGEGAGVVRIAGRTLAYEVVDPFDAADAGAAHRDEIIAPMPGAVVEVHAAAGAALARGEPVITIESMKLQTVLVAPRDGTLAAVLKGAGETFEKDEVVARLAALEGDA